MQTYSEDYKEKAFWNWYNQGKLSGRNLLLFLQEHEPKCPSLDTVHKWIASWRERAAELDQATRDKFSAEVIETKVEMLRRHAKQGKELQDIGMEWILENKDKLTASAVTRIIKDGYEMERLSVGVPEALEKMLSVSDEDLKKQIEDAIAGDDLELFDAD